ncbi:ricin-type beta-trefoil lectin domain protein [Streptomyces sp. NPDC055722]
MTDEQLAAELMKAAGKRPVHHPVGELLGRHWEAAYSYARLCADGAHPAGMLTTAAFTRLFEESARQGGPTAAWRPPLLVTIRRLAGEWDTDHRRALLRPALRSGADSAARAAARLLPAENRRLISRAFQRLPEPTRCLLWHAEVEREEVTVPAALLGMDPAEAATRLVQARERLREVCLDVHRESAPDEECRRYARLLDVSLRRDDGALDPDLCFHMDGCAHCRNAAEQLDGFGGRLPLLLAEGVLGWGAQAYLDTKRVPGEAAEPPAAPAPRPVGGEPLIDPAGVNSLFAADRPAPEPNDDTEDPAPPDAPDGRLRRGTRATSAVGVPRPAAAHKAAARPSPQRRRLALAVAAVGALVLIPLAVWSGVRSGDPSTTAAGATSGRPGPGTVSGSGAPSWIGAAASVPTGAFEGRLRNQDSGLCIGLDQKAAVAEAEAVLVSCSASVTQQWAYETGGLLRSMAAPGLCLDSHLGYSVQLAACARESQPVAKNIRYDFTRQGAIVPRWNEDLALTPASSAPDAGLVLKPCTEDDTQRWLTDTSNSLQMQSVDWGTAAPTTTPAARRAEPSRTPTRATGAAPKPTSSPAPTRPTDLSTSRGWGDCSSPSCAPDGWGGSGGWGWGGGPGGGRH